MYEICELIRYGDDERQLALEQLFAKAGVKTCSQAVSASKSTTSRSYLHSWWTVFFPADNTASCAM